jgi:hypothetical protein
MRFIHYDEARKAATDRAREYVARAQEIERMLLVDDLFGKLRIVIWAPEQAFDIARAELQRELAEGCGQWWTGEMLRAEPPAGPGADLWEGAWNEAPPDPEIGRLRRLERHRSRAGWFVRATAPVWQAPAEGPPVVVFYSFKGGVGRSTALASFAIQRARAGERVAVLDFDLDAPGIGTLLAADPTGITAQWGVVDYLLEWPHGDVPLDDYHHSCARLSDSGEIRVFPAGRLDEGYAEKLARVALEESSQSPGSGLVHLLQTIRATLSPWWILLDARAGLSEPAGRLLSGIAHLHVLFGTTAEQSWRGLRPVIDRLGRQRVLADQTQAEIVLVQAMVPSTAESARVATTAFAERAREEFTQIYYAVEPGDPGDDRFWDVRDLDSEDAPHAPLVIAYRENLAHFRDVADVADTLCEGNYVAVAERIAERFRRQEA